MPNAIAYLVLFSFPLVVVFLFVRLPVVVAAAATIVYGYLFLPPSTGLNLPLLPTLDKDFIPAACAAAFYFKFRKELGVIANRENKFPQLMEFLCLGCLIFGPFATFINNQETLIFDERVLPSIGLFDAFNSIMTLSASLFAFFVGRLLLASENGRRALIIVLAIAGVVYSIPILLEIRLSPQLNRMIYGFHAHQFAQQIRGDSFRAMVFIEHGIYVAFFLTTATIACIGAAQASTNTTTKTRWFLAAAWLLIVLFLSKTLGSLILVIFFGFTIVFIPRRFRLVIMAGVAIVVLSYPILRANNVIPVDKLLSFAESINEFRAASLNVRLSNEEALLEKALQKPLTGWGGWGRNRIYDEAGNDTSLTDGQWILVFGSFGWLGYIGLFGLFCLPQILLVFYYSKLRPSASTVALSVIQCANTVSMIPDATISPISWIIAGTLWASLLTKQAQNETASELDEEEPDKLAFRRRKRPKKTPEVKPRVTVRETVRETTKRKSKDPDHQFRRKHRKAKRTKSIRKAPSDL